MSLTLEPVDGADYRKMKRALVDAVIFALSIVPLLMTAHLPLFDLPNHLARQYILFNWSSSAALQEFYSYHWAVVPNLGLELFVAVAHHVVSIDLAVRLFCILALGFIFLGVRLVNTWFGGPSAGIYRVTPLFFYAGPFQYGFVNYWFGIGLALVAYGLYLRHRDRALLRRAAIFIPFGSAILLCHIAAFGLYAVAVASLEFSRSLAGFNRRALRVVMSDIVMRQGAAACYLVPPLLLLAALGPPAEHHLARWGVLHEKLESIAALTTFSSPRIELSLLVLCGVGFGAAMARGLVRLHRDGWPMLAAMTIVFLALPRAAAGGYHIDYRVPAAATLFLLGHVIPAAGLVARDGRVAMALQAWFSALVIVRVGLIAWLWLSWEPTFAQFDAAFERLPVGARLMVVGGEPSSTSEIRHPPLYHVTGYAVARRQVFAPDLFANIAGQILEFQPRYQPLWLMKLPDTLTRIDPIYDYLLVVRPKLAHISPELPLTSIAKGDAFELFRIEPSR